MTQHDLYELLGKDAPHGPGVQRTPCANPHSFVSFLFAVDVLFCQQFFLYDQKKTIILTYG